MLEVVLTGSDDLDGRAQGCSGASVMVAVAAANRLASARERSSASGVVGGAASGLERAQAVTVSGPGGRLHGESQPMAPPAWMPWMGGASKRWCPGAIPPVRVG